MSIKVMSRVWAESKQSEGALLILLAIADFADDNGRAFPSVTTLATKARMSERHARRLLRQLEIDGEIRCEVNTGYHGCNVYHVLPQEGDKMSGGQNVRGTPETGGGTFEAQNVSQMSPEPSLNHQKEPSEKTVFARTREEQPPEPQTNGNGEANGHDPNDGYDPRLDVSEHPNEEQAVTDYESEFAAELPHGRATNHATEQIMRRVSDNDSWRRVLAKWRTNGYSFRNLDGMFAEYDALIERERKRADRAKPLVDSCGKPIFLANGFLNPDAEPSEYSRAHVERMFANREGRLY